MMRKQARRFVLSVVMALSAVTRAEVSRHLDLPPRPDLSAMSATEAERALAEYSAARAAWQQRMQEQLQYLAPLREAAIKAAREKAEVQKKASAAGTATHKAPRWIVNPGENYAWEADARAHGLPEPALELLRRDGVVVAGPDFTQSFTVYSDSSLVPFVTTDSMLNGFHVLLEVTLKRFEVRRAQRLRLVLERTWSNLDRQLRAKNVAPAVVEPYTHHLALVIGPALRLLGSNVRLGDSAVEAEIDATLKQIVAAKEVTLPKWLGPPTPAFVALDFRRCEPLGFYTDTPLLADYYRATRWLQQVPLRASREIEAGAAALFADLETGNRADGLERYVEEGALVWGKGSHPTVLEFAARTPQFLATIAQSGNTTQAVLSARHIMQLGRGQKPAVDDRLRLRATNASAFDDDVSLTILAPSVLPDALFLAAIAEKRPLTQSLPNGLEVAAWLGSEFALAQLRSAGERPVADAIDSKSVSRYERPAWNDPVPVYYYHVLRSVFATPDPAVPDFMRSEAWHRKSVQTALSGWAQLRHAWELQTKLIVTAMSGSSRPAGFVEPNAEFFRRLTKLANVTVDRLQEAGVFHKEPADEAELLRQGLRTMDRLGFGKVRVDIGELDPIREGAVMYELAWIAHEIDETVPVVAEVRNTEQIAAWSRIRRVIQTRIAALEQGERVVRVDSRLVSRDPDSLLFRRWQLLSEMSGQFEAMVQKELRGADWNEEEAQLLTGYQEHLGELMGYVASATLMPEDDAPRWTTVYHDASSNRQLAVGIGRPRSLFVLYPWKGQRVLCRGAVMPYYEYSSERRLTDQQWRAVLDGGNAPAQPPWIQPLISPPSP